MEISHHQLQAAVTSPSGKSSVGPRAGLNMRAKEKILTPARNQTPVI